MNLFIKMNQTSHRAYMKEDVLGEDIYYLIFSGCKSVWQEVM